MSNEVHPVFQPLVDAIAPKEKDDQRSADPKLTLYGPTGEWLDPDHHYYSRREVDAMLQAIFDPENQPSQYGTVLVAQDEPEPEERESEEYDPYEAAGESRFGLPGGGKSL